MAKLPRKTQKIFCSKPTSENQTSVFGTMKTADKQYSTDVGTLQSNAAYEQGWKSATIASYKPFMEDFNTLNYINTSQLAYLFQQGIPEWDEATAYYKNSFCSYNGDLWQSLIDDNLGNAPFEGDEWTLFTSKNKGSGLELCDIGMSLYVDETKGLRRYLNGQIVDINTNTQAFLNRLKEITTLHPSLLCTEDEWQTAKTLSKFGQVGKFVFNYADDGVTVVSVRIPRVVNVQGLFDLQNLGMTVGESLPNIKSGVGLSVLGTNAGQTGAIVPNSREWGLQGGTTTYEFIGHIDASAYNKTYQDNAPVQQEAIQYPYFIQIATGSETENNIVNDIELNNPFSLFDSKYSDHELNNISWLKSEGQWNAKAVYPTAYDELLREYNNPDRLATFNRDAFEVVGSPIISEDGVASGFSDSNYIEISTSANTQNSWSVVGKFKTTNLNTLETLFLNYMPGVAQNRVEVFVNYGKLASSVNVDGINIAVTSTGSYRINANTEYYFKLEFTGSSYRFYYSLDGNNWVRIWSVNNSKNVYQTKIRIGNDESAGRAFQGSIDLKQFSITVDGKRVLSGANSMVKLSTETYTDYDFVLNTAEETFRLPLKTKLASGKAVVGNGMAIGVTNGPQNAGLNGAQSSSTWDVFNPNCYGLDVSSSGPPAGHIAGVIGITTDPTKSGIELSDSGLYLYYYVGETVQNAKLIDAGRIGEQLANKQDKCIHIIDTYVNGTSWYRVWSDGWCEQGGKHTATANTNTTITLIKQFNNTGYNLLLTGTYEDAGGQYSVQEQSKSSRKTSSFVVRIGGYSNSQDSCYWQACGYLAEGQY